MIYTRFGNRVKIISGNIATNQVDVVVIYKSKAELMKTFIHELRADEGIQEIHQAIIKANKLRDHYLKGGKIS
ncbi:MAG: hypothetical protein U5K00_21225 [Melioribacteraceae bacterium]|nr:hypothetical protein [Melioribacteraceae bacterium]